MAHLAVVVFPKITTNKTKGIDASGAISLQMHFLCNIHN